MKKIYGSNQEKRKSRKNILNYKIGKHIYIYILKNHHFTSVSYMHTLRHWPADVLNLAAERAAGSLWSIWTHTKNQITLSQTKRHNSLFGCSCNMYIYIILKWQQLQYSSSFEEQSNSTTYVVFWPPIISEPYGINNVS